MLDPHHPLHRSIVRIRDKTGEIVGAGFLAAPTLVCTCAHVVCKALGLPPETHSPPTAVVSLDFPYLSEAPITALVEEWVPIQNKDGGGDIAVLRLTSKPSPDARPARLLPVSNLSGREFAAFGFPYTFDFGQNAYGILHDRLVNGWVELQGTTAHGYRVQQGYSGTPVWDARGRGVVGMVVAEDSTARVAFLIPNDLIQQSCPDIKPITFSQMFKPLTDGLLGLPGGLLNGMEQFLLEYLGKPESPTPFGGRDKQLAELDRWLATPGQPYALLVAEAGRGKSALLARWVATVADEQRAEVVLVPISIRFSTSLKSTTLSLLGARLRYLHSVTADFLHDTNAWLAEIEMYLHEDRPADPPLLIVLDGADEAADWTVGRDLRFPPQPGYGIKVLVSARSLAHRDATEWLQRLQWQSFGVLIELPLLDRSGVAEVLRQMGFSLDRLGARVDIVAELYRLSDRGDPLLVRLYVDDLWQRREATARLQPEDLQAIRPGLGGYFEHWWEDQQQQWKDQGRDPLGEREDTQDFLNLCAMALGPLTRDEVAAIAGGRHASGLRLQAIVSEVGRFISGDGRTQGYIFSHPRFGYYFCEEQMTEQERREWEQRFLDYGQRTLEELDGGKLNPHQAPPYVVRYYSAHLERAGAQAQHYYALVNAGWLQAWEALEGTYDGFVNDMAHAWRQAEAAGAREQPAANRGGAIGLQCRYALIGASIKSLVGNIPPALLGALVDKNVWTPAQGLAYAWQMSNKTQRAEALAELAPHLSASLLREGLTTARTIKDVGAQAQAMLVSRLGALGYGQEALVAVQTIEQEDAREQVLAELAPHLAELLQTETLQEALAAVRTIEQGDNRELALEKLAPHLSEPLLREALAVARTIKDAYYRGLALVKLAPHLSESLQAVTFQEALAAARTIEEEHTRARVLARLAPHLEHLSIATLYPLWCETLHILASRTRSDLLSDIGVLLPIVTVLGEKEALVTIAQAIIEVGKWFP